MDERHWWIATKIQETFHIGGIDNPSLLETYLTQEDTITFINSFLAEHGIQRMFFFARNTDDVLTTEGLFYTSEIPDIRKVLAESSSPPIVLFFLRSNIDSEINASTVEKEIYCGEVKTTALESVSSMLSDLFLPVMKNKNKHTFYGEEQKSGFSAMLEKSVHILADTTNNVIQKSKAKILREPDPLTEESLKHHRHGTLDHETLVECEKLVTDWITTIESIVLTSADERFMDTNMAPLGELERWQRRHRTLTALTEQLKGKECKSIIGFLITGKSKLLKRWKSIDIAITDAVNDTRDKVKYLEGLKRHFEVLYDKCSPDVIVSQGIVPIINTMKQTDSVSRYYARTGFLGSLFSKISNQLVTVSKAYIKEFCSVGTDEEGLWKFLDDELKIADPRDFNDITTRQLRGYLEQILKVSRARTSDLVHLGMDKHTLVGRLKSCLVLQAAFRDYFRQLRDSLGAHGGMSHTPSVASMQSSQYGVKAYSSRGDTGTKSGMRTGTGGSMKKTSIAGTAMEICGISMHDEDSIMSHMDNFCGRVRQVLDMLHSFYQLHSLQASVFGLPRPRREHMNFEEFAETREQLAERYQQAVREGGQTALDEEEEEALQEAKEVYSAQQHLSRNLTTADTGPLASINEDVEAEKEEEEEEENAAELQEDFEDLKEDNKRERSPRELSFGQYTTTKEDFSLLERFYGTKSRGSEDVTSLEADEGPTVSDIVKGYISQLRELVVSRISVVAMLDVESKDKTRFDEVYVQFLRQMQELERFFCAYLYVVMMRKMKTKEALDILQKLYPIQHRSSLKAVINEKIVDIFNNFENDLMEIRALYENQKFNPPRQRNAPVVAGAVAWARQLLLQVSAPMHVFKEAKAVTTLKDYPRIVRIYNRIASTLVEFENLYLSQWRLEADAARDGLRASLLRVDRETGDLLVNADERLVKLVHEARWLSRIGVEIPEVAQMALNQELRLKVYTQNLQECLDLFKRVLAKIPADLKVFYTRHVEAARSAFQPGLSTIAWNNMNIDAFLYNLRKAVNSLDRTLENINSIIKDKIVKGLENIGNMNFFNISEALDRKWPPEEFLTVSKAFMEEQLGELQSNIKQIEASIREVASILGGKVTHHGRVVHDSEEAAVLKELSNLFFVELYTAILKATVRSLVTLAEASGCDRGRVAAAVASQTDLDVGFVSASRQSDNASVEGSATVSRPQSGVVPSLKSRVTSGRQSSASSVGAKDPISLSRLSLLSNMSWQVEEMIGEISLLRFEVLVKYDIPSLRIDPDMTVVQSILNQLSEDIVNFSQTIDWMDGVSIGEAYHEQLVEDKCITSLTSQIQEITQEIQPLVKKHLLHIASYDFLWKDNLNGNFADFKSHDPSHHKLTQEVLRLVRLENNIHNIPEDLQCGCVCLQSKLIKNVLQGFSVTWKETFASALHEEAKRQLTDAIAYRLNVYQRLEVYVSTLDQLNSTLHLLEELRDKENIIDGVYLPIENAYAALKSYNMRLPRSELAQVDALRTEWQNLIEMAEGVRAQLLKERRVAFEQELDKQVKLRGRLKSSSNGGARENRFQIRRSRDNQRINMTFVVEVIQFRNSFDAQGPAVPGISPSEAVARLHEFQKMYTQYDTKRKTLDSVSKLFGIPVKSFPELDKTGEELQLLGLLYGLFQKFIKFDEKFRATLWSEVELDAMHKEVESCWDECLALPSKLKDWDAYNDMKNQIQTYLQILPLLKKLASKEIRNRHWLQVMQVTASSFQLEANVFHLNDLMTIGLIENKRSIEEICWCAQKEQELEIKMRQTEEEWTEQVLSFQPYKRRGPILLDKSFTERLLEQLEDSQAMLATMLTSKYIGPLRDEAASWAEKLKEVGEVLELWVEVQELWQDLEAVFSVSETAKELPQEAKRFDRLDRSYVKMMKRAFDTRNVLQCCHGGEVPKSVVLKHIYEELEICFKSLVLYLDQKRRTFPRFYFVTDPVLLSMLNRPNDLESVRPYLRCIFTSIADFRYEKRIMEEKRKLIVGSSRPVSELSSRQGLIRRQSGRDTYADMDGPKVDRRLQGPEQVSETPRSTARRSQVPTGLPPGALSVTHNEEVPVDDFYTYEVTSVLSAEGEELVLDSKIVLEDAVEQWLSEIQDVVGLTLEKMNSAVITDISEGGPLEELAFKYPAQVCRLALIYYWTRECEFAVSDLRNDRKALQNLLKKFSATVSRLPTILYRGAWKTIDEDMTIVHKVRLENMVTQSLYLRDCLESMCNRKIREITDFDWRRNLRCNVNECEGAKKPFLFIMDHRFNYGSEFYGTHPILALTPITDRCFVSMVTAMDQYKGCVLQGGSGVGKTETVRGLAQLLSYHLMVVQGRPTFDVHAAAKVFQGLAVDGCWGLFDEVHKFQAEAFAVLMDHMQGIFNAVKCDLASCIVGDSAEFPVTPSVAVFLTHNPSKESVLAKEVKTYFRSVAVVKPDFNQVLKAKCTAMGFRAPHVLCNRIKIVCDLAQDQLPDDIHHQFSLTALTGCLDRAQQRRKILREERSELQVKESSSAQVSFNPNVGGQSGILNEYWPPLREKTPKTPLTGALKNTYGKKAGTPTPLSPAAKVEHSLVGHAVLEVIGPRLKTEHQTILKTIIRDVFCGLPEPMRSTSAREHQIDVEHSLTTVAKEKGWMAHQSWLAKCVQLHNVSSVHQGIVLAGPPGSGKSAALEALVGALCICERTPGLRANENNHRLQRLYPMIVDDYADMFGSMRGEQGWLDGIFTATLRKANRNQAMTWLCLDGPLVPSWADNFNSVLERDSVLNLPNGDRLFVSENVKIVFETDSLAAASPAIVSRSGIVYFSEETLGWRPIALSWLEGRNALESHALTRAFEKTLDPVIQFMTQEAKPSMTVSTAGAFQMTLGLLSAMLAENKEIGGEVHIERLYLFCLIWSFGGFLSESEGKQFSDLLKTVSTALPDDDRDICVFDYYVDESGEWDPWVSRVPETVSMESFPLTGYAFVDTVETVRIRLLLEFAVLGQQNVLMVGPRGAGKSILINEFVNSQDNLRVVKKTLVFSKWSTAQQLQTFIESNIRHRQGFVYGAKDNKRLQLFIDDLNLPAQDSDGVQRCNELIRQLLDKKTLTRLQRPFEWRQVEELNIVSTMAVSDCPGVDTRGLDTRLMRHFAVINVPALSADSLRQVISGIFEAHLNAQDSPGLDIDLHNRLVEATSRLYGQVKEVLRMSTLPGREHYLYNLKDFNICCQCLCRLPQESRADDATVVSFWAHELRRIITDRVGRTEDLLWFEETMTALVTELWPDLTVDLHQLFITFSNDLRQYQRPITSQGVKQVKVSLQPISSVTAVHDCLKSHLGRYNEEFGNVFLDITLSNAVIEHVVRMHRVLSFSKGGHLLLIGAIGTHLSTICRLALHVADLPVLEVDTTRRNSFFDGLRSAVRLAGSEGKVLSILLTARGMNDEVFLDALNSLLISGSYPHLFSNDELDGLLQAILHYLKKENPALINDPMKYFVSRVKANLHVILCLPPGHWLLKRSVHEYPGILTQCQVNWFRDWPQEALRDESDYFLAHRTSGAFDEEDLRGRVALCMAQIHDYVLEDCGQTPWAGQMGAEVTLNNVKVLEKRKDQVKITPTKLPNRPYGKSIVLEQIRHRHVPKNTLHLQSIPVGPMTYRRFLEIFRYLYTNKCQERQNRVNGLKKVLTALDQSRHDAQVMRKAIVDIKNKYEEACQTAAELLAGLTVKATRLEKLKAKFGRSGALNAFLHLNELEEDTYMEDDSLLHPEEEYDEFDREFDRLREESLKTRQVQAKEELSKARLLYQRYKKELEYAREQVLYWRSKVDRACLERIKQFQNPPTLVGQVMEMVFVLIGKTLPGMTRFERTDQGYPAEGSSGRMSASSSSTRPLQMKRERTGKTKESQDRVDKMLWKQMQLSMNDPSKFVDMLHNLPWEDGLDMDIMRAVENYLAQGSDGQLGVTGEGTLLDHAENAQFKATKQSSSPAADSKESKGITIAAAKYSSEDAATLVQYTIALVEYSQRCGPLRSAVDRVHELEREIEETVRIRAEEEAEGDAEQAAKATTEKEGDPLTEQEDFVEADISALQLDLEEHQARYDSSIVEKHHLEVELASMDERLRGCIGVVDSLFDMEKSWRSFVESFESDCVLLTNCLAASAFLTYCGPMEADARRRYCDNYLRLCTDNKLVYSSKLIFKEIDLINFLFNEVDIGALSLLRLPMTRLQLENACFLMLEEHCDAWPLLCDPSRRVLSWLQLYLQNLDCIAVKYHDVRSQLETCLSDGTILIVTDCDVNVLAQDRRMRQVLTSQRRFVQNSSPFKIMVGDHEVECQPSFRLFLHTSSLPCQVPGELAAYSSVVKFNASRTCLEEELLDRFLLLEKTRLQNERQVVNDEKLQNLSFLKALEEQIVDSLSSGARLMNDLALTRKLSEIKKQHEETLESQLRVEMSEQTISKARSSYRQIARRAAVCFETSQYMSSINSLYLQSYQQFLDIFDISIQHSDRASTRAVVDRLTLAIHQTTSRAILEQDRPIYAMLLALEVCDANGEIGIGEREFIISPQLGAALVGAYLVSVERGGKSPDPRFSQMKKPFDWMLDEQFANLQLLAVNFEWFQEMFDRMPRDGRETQWRNLVENDTPESAPLPDKMDDSYSPLQRLCIVRSVRPDRLMQAANVFVTAVLGKKFAGDAPPDLAMALRYSALHSPVLLLYSHEASSAERLFRDLARRRNMEPVLFQINDETATTERCVKRILHRGMADGSWVLLHTISSAPSIMLSAASYLEEQQKDADPTFRCFMSAEIGPHLPSSLIQVCTRLVLDSPRMMKDSLLRSFTWIDNDALKSSHRNEWPGVLHNLFFLHGVLRLRARFPFSGWSRPRELDLIGDDELSDSIRLVTEEFQDNLTTLAADGSEIARPTSYQGLKYLMTETIYGNYMTDSYDLQTLGTIVDYWISPNSIRKDFEVARLKYRVPAVFFGNYVRIGAINQALENIQPYFLDCPEACHIHPTSENLLGDEQYVFTRLNAIFDAMPTSRTLKHSLFERIPPPTDGPILSMISSTSQHPLIAGLGVMASGGMIHLRSRKEAELWEICHQMLSRVPRAYSREYIQERVKKIGGATIFNNFVVHELELMFKLVSDIKATLMAIKTAVELNQLGDRLSQEEVEAADALYYSRIPRCWLDLAGPTAPPDTYPLGNWLIELQSRCQHLERILVLGRDKMPAYWLGAFYNPRALLALMKQDAYVQQAKSDRSGNLEPIIFQTELTSRDKDHLRDPPAEGIFVYGFYLWGCSWEKTAGELSDSPPRQPCASLPVVHLTCCSADSAPRNQDTVRAAELFSCPVYHSRHNRGQETILELDLHHEGIVSSRWSLRGVQATLRPY